MDKIWIRLGLVLSASVTATAMLILAIFVVTSATVEASNWAAPLFAILFVLTMILGFSGRKFRGYRIVETIESSSFTEKMKEESA